MTKWNLVMEKMFHIIGADFKNRAHQEIERGTRDAAVQAVARLSRGSVGTQLRSFMTIEDMERERKEVRDLDFVD